MQGGRIAMHPRTLDPRTLGEAAGRGSTRDDGASTAAASAALLLADLRQSGSGDDDDCARGAALAGVSVDVNPRVVVKSGSLLRDRSIFAGGSSLWHSRFLAVAVLAWWIAALLGLTVFVVGMKETADDPAQPLIEMGNEHSSTHSALLPTPWRPVMGGLNWYELFFNATMSKFFAYLNRILYLFDL